MKQTDRTAGTKRVGNAADTAVGGKMQTPKHDGIRPSARNLMGPIRYAGLVIVMTFGLWAATAQAIINPRFTPVKLVQQSAKILVVEVQQSTSNECTLTVRESLKPKGEIDEKVIKLDLTTFRNEASLQTLRDLTASVKSALFFVGEYNEGGASAGPRGLLHIDGQWVSCAKPEGRWLYDTIDTELLAVWNGGTDMLRRVVEYIQSDEDAEVPVEDGVAWSAGPQKLATLDGVIRDVRPVDLAGDGKPMLFVARDKGDRLLACEKGARTFTDVTAARSLQSASVAYAWGDFCGQRRLDLISFNGKAVTLHAQQADGRFRASPLDLGKAIENGCLSLAALDVGDKDRAGLLVGGNALPVVITLDAAGKATGTPLTAPGIDLAKLGKAGVSLVADFNRDGVADVVALRAEGSILFLGKAPGQYQAGAASAVKCGDAFQGASLGDYDGDGNLDILVAGGMTRFMWINDGKGGFAERFGALGEMMTHDQSIRATGCMAADVNNDGRQDVLLTYANAPPVTYFGRGFLSFGHSHTIDISEKTLLPDANHARDGAQSGCLADLDGDGAQDLVLALASGEVWVFFREITSETRMAVAVVPLGAAYKGPVTVTGWDEKRCLGAWNVAPGVGLGAFGRQVAGPMTLKWRLPGGNEQSKEIVLEKSGMLKVEIK